MCFFLESLRLYKDIIADQGCAGEFMFQYGLIPNLLVVALSATRRATGWEAIGVLRSTPRADLR
jgi:hypothetical protein